MTFTQNHTSNINNKKSDQLKQGHHIKKSTNVLESKPIAKQLKYDLTSNQEFSTLKTNLLLNISTFLQNNDYDVHAQLTQLFKTQEQLLKGSLTKCNLITSPLSVEEIALFGEFPQISPLLGKYQNRLQNYLLRLQNLKQLMTLLPDITNSDLFKGNLIEYQCFGICPFVDMTPLKNALSKITNNELKLYLDQISKAQNQPINAEISTILIELTSVFNQLQTYFKKAYLLYKEMLDLMVINLQLKDQQLFEHARKTFYDLIYYYTPTTNFYDFHYALVLIQIYFWKGSQKYSKPIYPTTFDPKLKMNPEKQIVGHLNEIYTIMLFAIVVDIQKDQNPNTIFKNIDVTKRINKSPQFFFDKPMGKTTYSLLIDYLSLLNQSLLIHFTQQTKNP